MASANSTADRAIDILLMFNDDQPVISAADVAERFGMPRSTTYRYLMSLRTKGLLIEAGDSQYRLGPRIFTLARVAREGYSIIHTAETELRKLADATGETILLTQRDGATLTVLECIVSAQPVRISYNRGQILPTPATASAKVMLAYDDEKRTQALLRRKRLTQYTKHTVTDPVQIARDLAAVRARGFATNRNEVDEGATAIAAPIFESDGSVRHAVSVAAPSFRVTERQLEKFAPLVKAAAAAITAAHSAYDVRLRRHTA
jgi:DNA-binding IclR family transcriptional regulator